MGHWTKRRLKEGDRFGDQHFILLLYHSMKCGSYLSTLLRLHHSPHTLSGVVVHVVRRVGDKIRKLCWMPLCLVGEGEMVSLPTSSSCERAVVCSCAWQGFVRMMIVGHLPSFFITYSLIPAWCKQ
jgi:hypothetical protein